MKIILISIDALRQDKLGCYGDKNNLTPAIDKLAKEGVIFTTAFTVANTTTPSHCSILTGCYPTTHGVINNGWKLKDNPTIASVLKEKGYTTAGAVGVKLLSTVYGFGKGFDKFYNVSKMDRIMHYLLKVGHGRFTLDKIFRYIKFINVVSREAKQTNKIVFDWIDQNYDKDFFLFVHYQDIHADTFGKKKTLKEKTGNYDENVKIIDSAINEIVEKLKEQDIFDKIFIIISSDHGDSLGESSKLGHGWHMNDTEFRVPLIMYNKGILPSKRVDFLARTIDIMPTILDVLKIPVYFKIDGTSLVGSIFSDEECCDGVFMEACPTFVDIKGIRTNRFIYALKDEKEEQLLDNHGNNVLEQNKEEAFKLRLKVKEHFNIKYEQQEIDKYTGKVLKDLGYKK